jgi:hypothetical protein
MRVEPLKPRWTLFRRGSSFCPFFLGFYVDFLYRNLLLTPIRESITLLARSIPPIQGSDSGNDPRQKRGFKCPGMNDLTFDNRRVTKYGITSMLKIDPSDLYQESEGCVNSLRWIYLRV